MIRPWPGRARVVATPEPEESSAEDRPEVGLRWGLGIAAAFWLIVGRDVYCCSEAPRGHQPDQQRVAGHRVVAPALGPFGAGAAGAQGVTGHTKGREMRKELEELVARWRVRASEEGDRAIGSLWGEELGCALGREEVFWDAAMDLKRILTKYAPGHGTSMAHEGEEPRGD